MAVDLERIVVRGVSTMEMKSFLVTMGVGIAAGATAALMLPRHSKVRKVAQSAADSVEDVISRASCCMSR